MINDSQKDNFLGLYTEVTGGRIYTVTHETEFEMVTECLLMQLPPRILAILR